MFRRTCALVAPLAVLLCLAPAAELKRRYRAETLEEAFFSATGAVLAEEEEASE